MVTTDGRSRVRLPDGRRLDVWQGGDPGGLPVLFFHGTPGGRLQAALGNGAARRTGVRLVAFSRPGYGGSTDTPTTLSTVADDAAAVMRDVGETYAVLGVSGGGPYALATAARHADRVSAVAVVAGIGPVLDLEPEAAHRPAVRAALAGDVELAVVLQDAAATGCAASAGDSRSRHRPGLPGAGFVSPEVLEPWTAAGRPGVPSYRGASRDALASSAGWDVALSDVRAPVTLWYGDHDHVVGLEQGRWLHAHLPTSRLVVHEGAGHHATLMVHWADVLTDLVGGSG